MCVRVVLFSNPFLYIMSRRQYLYFQNTLSFSDVSSEIRIIVVSVHVHVKTGLCVYICRAFIYLYTKFRPFRIYLLPFVAMSRRKYSSSLFLYVLQKENYLACVSKMFYRRKVDNPLLNGSSVALTSEIRAHTEFIFTDNITNIGLLR